MKTLIVDTNYLCHRAFHTTGDLEYEEIKSGVVFGVLRQIKELGERFKTNKFLFCWDHRPYHREKLFPDYKRKRNSMDKLSDIEKKDVQRRRKEAFQQFTALRKEILPGLGFKNIYSQKGYEADDLIAKIAQRRKGDYLIVSADEDLYQLLMWFDMYKPQMKKTVNRYSVQDEYGASPSQWAHIKAIAGCTSDNIPGIAGVAEKTAARYLNGTLGKHTKAYQHIEEAGDLIRRNMPLVKLPFKGTKLYKIREDKFDMKYFYTVCSNYGLASLANESKKWIRFFKGDFS